MPRRGLATPWPRACRRSGSARYRAASKLWKSDRQRQTVPTRSGCQQGRTQTNQARAHSATKDDALRGRARRFLFQDSLRRAHSANIRKGRLLHDLSVKAKVVFSHSARRETSLKFVAHATTV